MMDEKGITMSAPDDFSPLDIAKPVPIGTRLPVSVIKYASVLPGTGKTHWAVKQMIKCVEGGKGVVIYAAPTLVLLTEVEKLLKERLPKRRSRIRTVASNGKHADAADHRTTLQEIKLLLAGGVTEVGTPQDKVKPGSVILCTHETFLRIPAKFREGVIVIFDEARKCTMSVESFTFTPEIFAKLTQDFIELDKTEDVPSTSLTDKYFRLNVRKYKEADLFAVLRAAGMSQSARTRFARLLAESTASVELLALVSASKDTRQVGVNFQTLLIPSKVFYGWKGVYMLSAFFEVSQMYHLLKASEYHPFQLPSETAVAFTERRVEYATGSRHLVTLVDITDKVVDANRVEKVKKRFAATRIAYLSETPFSINTLKSGVLYEAGSMNDQERLEFQRRYTELAVAKKKQSKANSVRSLRSALRLSTDPGDQKPDKYDRALIECALSLPGLVADYTPLQWYTKQAVKMSKKWYKKHNKEVLPLLVTCNGGDANLQYAREIEAKVPVTDWIKLPFRAQGLNKYSNYDTVAFLASFNAKPQVVRLMNQLCPEYDPKLDYALDQCIQSATRCSIRNPKSEAKPLLIVIGKDLAQAAQAHLLGLPKILSPEKFGIPILNNLYAVGSDMVKTADYQRRYRNRTEVKVRASAYARSYRDREHIKAWEAFQKANSKFLAREKNLKAKVSKQGGSKAPAQLHEELATVREQLGKEKVRLLPKFEAAHPEYEGKITVK